MDGIRAKFSLVVSGLSSRSEEERQWEPGWTNRPRERQPRGASLACHLSSQTPCYKTAPSVLLSKIKASSQTGNIVKSQQWCQTFTFQLADLICPVDAFLEDFSCSCGQRLYLQCVCKKLTQADWVKLKCPCLFLFGWGWQWCLLLCWWIQCFHVPTTSDAQWATMFCSSV